MLRNSVLGMISIILQNVEGHVSSMNPYRAAKRQSVSNTLYCTMRVSYSGANRLLCERMNRLELLTKRSRGVGQVIISVRSSQWRTRGYIGGSVHDATPLVIVGYFHFMTRTSMVELDDASPRQRQEKKVVSQTKQTNNL